jgi:hypothetical protein
MKESILVSIIWILLVAAPPVLAAGFSAFVIFDSIRKFKLNPGVLLILPHWLCWAWVYAVEPALAGQVDLMKEARFVQAIYYVTTLYSILFPWILLIVFLVKLFKRRREMRSGKPERQE